MCQRLGISIQPARIRTGRDKGPVERFFRSIREDLLQGLPGYKGPDLFSRGNRPENEAYFFLDELVNIVREWVATTYHLNPHRGLLDPNLGEVEFSPRAMLEHGIARAGYLEVPRDPDLAYEFLATEWRTIQHYGVEIRGRRYDGVALNPYRNLESPYTGKARGRWPFHRDPDDVSRVYFRDPHTREWHVLVWEHAAAMDMPLSEDGLLFARKRAAQKYKFPDDKVAVADLFERWRLGLGQTLSERRMTLRLAREPELRDTADTDAVSSLPSVAHIFTDSPEEQNSGAEDQDTALDGDDDSDDDDDGDFLCQCAGDRVNPGQMNPELTETLDDLTLTPKEGWQAFVNHQKRLSPEILTQRQINALGEKARSEYDQSRRRWHANLGPFETPQWKELHEDLWDIVDSNAQTNDKAKGGVALDAFPGLGKMATVLAFGAEFERREIQLNGRYKPAGHERLPVCRVGLTGNTGMLDFNRAMLSFFAHPGTTRGTAAQFAERALDSMVKCKTRLLIIDELHFLQWRNSQGVAISNHFKHIANEFPVTLVFIGVGLESRGLFSEGTSYEDAVIAQTGRRTTRLEMRPFTIKNDCGRRDWRNLLLAIEQQLVLADKKEGMLADDLSDYLFARSTGHIGSLMTLINRGCQRAMRSGVERLDRDLLDRVKNDAASEKARKELEPSFASHRLTSRPRRRSS